ncbi:hypothetical protein [Luteolibacter sp. Populi]|uniref:hypothetical protein n=1 Tax=Luteolibacter sp. Populi TaxID=3230487 RepID=UPI0034667F1E
MFRAAGVLVIGMGAVLSAGPLELGRTPVLSASLPGSTTWQVEQLQAGGAWTGTGVLVGGAGLPVSVRMEGFPATASYRFQRVAGAAAPLAPVVGTGWHLAGQEPGAAGQVEIEKSADLAAWGDEALVFPRTDGRYVRALREPLGARGFFRARVPGLATGDASVTSHTPLPNNQGAAGFGPIYADMPQIFKDGFIGALSPTEYHRGGENAAAAGECYELAGPFGRVTVMITDLTDAPPGTVDVGRSFFDLGETAYPPLSGGAVTGALTAGMRLVPAPVTGNVKLYVVPGSSIYYTELRPYNYRAGINKVEIQSNGSTDWVNMPRSASNSFVFLASSIPLAFPVKVRVSSRFGEVVTFPAIPAMADNQKITGPAQFAVFPELAPVPEHRVRPMYRDALTKVPGDQWSAGGYGGATVTEVDPAVAYAGTASLRLSGLGGYAGVTFSEYPGFLRPEFGVLKLAIRSAAPVAADQTGLIVYGVNVPGGPQVNSAVIQLPPLKTAWQVFQVPLQASGAPATIFGASLFGRVPGALPNVWIDEVEVLNY